MVIFFSILGAQRARTGRELLKKIRGKFSFHCKVCSLDGLRLCFLIDIDANINLYVYTIAHNTENSVFSSDTFVTYGSSMTHINPLNAELNSIYHLLALRGTRHILHVSRIRVKYRCFPLTFALIMGTDSVPCEVRTEYMYVI